MDGALAMDRYNALSHALYDFVHSPSAPFLHDELEEEAAAE